MAQGSTPAAAAVKLSSCSIESTMLVLLLVMVGAAESKEGNEAVVKECCAITAAAVSC